MDICEQELKIALLTPYNGCNLGDAAIQDAMIHHLRLRLPNAKITGITLSCENFEIKHGVGSFALCANKMPFYGMTRGAAVDQRSERVLYMTRPIQNILDVNKIKMLVKHVPILGWILKMIFLCAMVVWRELRHCVSGYYFLRKQDLLIVSGGGQLDEEWGGAWGHPFALLEWAVLAWISRVPYTFASVGACKVISLPSRLFLSIALRLSCYRSYRDRESRVVASRLLRRAAWDSVVPDLAFSLPSSILSDPVCRRSISQGRTIIAVSLISYAKAHSWPSENESIYDRYLQQMTYLVSALLDDECFLVFVCSSLGDDESVILDLLERLDVKSKMKLSKQSYIPTIATWQEYVESIKDVDVLIASRLHSAILGLVNNTPTVAISFDSKVDRMMRDVGMSEYLLHICDFTAEDVLKAVESIRRRRDIIIEKAISYRLLVYSICELQYDILSGLAAKGRLRSKVEG